MIYGNINKFRQVVENRLLKVDGVALRGNPVEGHQPLIATTHNSQTAADDQCRDENNQEKIHGVFLSRS